MEPIAAFGHEVLRLVALAYPDFTDEASTVMARDVFLNDLHTNFQVPLCSKQETASATVTALVQEVKQLQLAGVGGAAISSSLADAHYDSAGPSHVGFPLASQSANQVSPAINQMFLFDSHGDLCRPYLWLKFLGYDFIHRSGNPALSSCLEDLTGWTCGQPADQYGSHPTMYKLHQM